MNIQRIAIPAGRVSKKEINGILADTNQALQTKQTDIEIIHAVLSGSKPAFRTLYERYAKNHLLTCLRYVKNKIDAEDVLQDAYILIYRDLKQYDATKSKYITWSNKVVVNTCLMHLRKNNILKFSEDINDVAFQMPVNENAISALSLKELTQLITQLPKGYRTVFNMFVIDGYSHREIAESLQISISTSKTQLLKARRMLQQNINNQHYTKPQNHV